jgi:hypothetical protein
MSYTVEVLYINGEAAGLMADMRTWLDRKQVEVEEFRSTLDCPGPGFRVGFREEDQALAFAEAFRGSLRSADPLGANHRTAPHR